ATVEGLLPDRENRVEVGARVAGAHRHLGGLTGARPGDPLREGVVVAAGRVVSRRRVVECRAGDGDMVLAPRRADAEVALRTDALEVETDVADADRLAVEAADPDLVDHVLLHGDGELRTPPAPAGVVIALDEPDEADAVGRAAGEPGDRRGIDRD